MNAIAQIPDPRQAALANRLMALGPEAVDINLLAKLRDLCGCAISIASRRIFPDCGPSISLPTEVRIAGDVSQSTAQQALRSIDAAFTPAPGSVLVEALIRLRAVTAKRVADDATASVIAAAYSEALREFPADIALAVLRKRRHWWPSLAELDVEARALMAGRSLLRRRFEAIAAGKAARLVEIAARPPGARTLPSGWRERAGMTQPAPGPTPPPAVDDAGLEHWTPDRMPVRISSELGAICAKEAALLARRKA